MKRISVILFVFSLMACMRVEEHEYVIRNNTNSKEYIDLSLDYKPKEQCMVNLLNTMTEIYKGKDIPGHYGVSGAVVFHSDGFCMSGALVSFGGNIRLLTNTGYNPLETDPKNVAFYTYVNNKMNSNKKKFHDATIYLKQIDGSDQFYYMGMIENPDTKIYEYAGHGMVNTRNFTLVSSYVPR